VAKSYLKQKDHYILVNYLRRVLGEERGGHISPLAAYDADADRFLILGNCSRPHSGRSWNWAGVGVAEKV
jgi:hypothetical protein